MSGRVLGGRQSARLEPSILDEDEGGFEPYTPSSVIHAQPNHISHKDAFTLSRTPSYASDGPSYSNKSGKRKRRSFSGLLKFFGLKKKGSRKKNSKHGVESMESIFSREYPMQDSPSSVIPAIIGIKNHGNTCFMNAVLQCLSNTDLLAQYFVMSHHLSDLKQTEGRVGSEATDAMTPRNAVTLQLAEVLQSLWRGSYTPDVSERFKRTVGSYCEQFNGCVQQDAQEFFMWLLDVVHEELDISSGLKKKSKPSKARKSTRRKTIDDSAAASRLANEQEVGGHSYVRELFQALYRSSVHCPACRKSSATFDPYTCISLPIPTKSMRPVYATLVRSGVDNVEPRKFGVTIETHASVLELKAKLSEECKVPAERLILTEMASGGFQRTLRESEPLASLADSAELYVFEAPDVPENTGTVVVLLQNLEDKPSGRSRFGHPFLFLWRLDFNCFEIQSRVLQQMNSWLSPEAQVQAQRLSLVFQLYLCDGPAALRLSSGEGGLDHPLLLPPVQRTLTGHAHSAGPAHIQVHACWDHRTVASLVSSPVSVGEDDFSVQQTQYEAQHPLIASLDSCFHMYTKEEELGLDDAWLCSHCKKRQGQATKDLGLWSLPDIFVIHLKRFHQNGPKRTKLNALVQFPVLGFDMGPHLARGDNCSTRAVESEWRHIKSSHPEEAGNLFDLYAVCNHYGTMNGGHYTSFCKNPASGVWFCYDDDSVTKLSGEQEIVTKAAYMLFYQRRARAQLESPGPTPGLGGKHWICQLPNVIQAFQSEDKDDSLSQTTSVDSISPDIMSSLRIENTSRRSNQPPRPRSAEPESSMRIHRMSSEPLGSSDRNNGSSTYWRRQPILRPASADPEVSRSKMLPRSMTPIGQQESVPYSSYPKNAASFRHHVKSSVYDGGQYGPAANGSRESRHGSRSSLQAVGTHGVSHVQNGGSEVSQNGYGLYQSRGSLYSHRDVNDNHLVNGHTPAGMSRQVTARVNSVPVTSNVPQHNVGKGRPLSASGREGDRARAASYRMTNGYHDHYRESQGHYEGETVSNRSEFRVEKPMFNRQPQCHGNRSLREPEKNGRVNGVQGHKSQHGDADNMETSV